MKNIKQSYKNNKLKISAPTWNENFELPAGSDVLDHFKYIIKKHKIVTDNLQIKNKITKVKTRYYLGSDF